MTTDARTLDTGRRRVIHPLRPGLHPLWPVLATALWIATLGNLALWRALYQYGLLHGWHGFIFAIGLGTALAALLVVLLGLLAWRRTLRPALVAALVTSAVATHFMLGYGVVIDRAMLVNVAQTHAAEAADLMTPSLLLTVSMHGLLPAWWTWRIPIATRPWPGQLRHNLLAAGAVVMGGTPESVVEKELSVFPGLNRAKFEFIDSTVVKATFAWKTRTSIFRKGLGCTLLSELTEGEVRRQNPALPGPIPFSADTVAWPLGDILSDSLPAGVNGEAILAAIEEAFVETDHEKPKNTLAIV